MHSSIYIVAFFSLICLLIVSVSTIWLFIRFISRGSKATNHSNNIVIDKTISYQRAPAAHKQCPRCRHSVGYYWFSGMGDMAPHFYCDRCSNIFHSKKHNQLLWNNKPNQPTKKLLLEIEATLPSCPCGGRFRSGQNPKCPHCGFEFKHQKNPVERLEDPYAILLENAWVISPEEE